MVGGVAPPGLPIESSNAENSRIEVSVADRILDKVSVEGQRSVPSGLERFEGLSAVGSRPARIARREVEMPLARARHSIAPHICAQLNIIPSSHPSRRMIF